MNTWPLSKEEAKAQVSFIDQRLECPGYQLGCELGSGSFGKVYKATHWLTGAVHALKVCTKSTVDDRLEVVLAEIEMMKLLSHPHIIKLHRSFVEEAHIVLAMEICLGGELLEAMTKSGRLSEVTASHLLGQILSSTAYMHAKCVSHRDLKPENFVLSTAVGIECAHLKMIDFGTAKRFDLGPMTTRICTVDYVAPEVLKHGSITYTEKVDVWSTGVILFGMLTAALPFASEDTMSTMKLIKKAKYNIPEYLSKGAMSLLEGLMCLKVADRLCAASALDHPWLSGTHQQPSAAPTLKSALKKRAIKVQPVSVPSTPLPVSIAPMMVTETNLEMALAVAVDDHVNETQPVAVAPLEAIGHPPCVKMEEPIVKIIEDQHHDATVAEHSVPMVAAAEDQQQHLDEEQAVSLWQRRQLRRHSRCL